MATITHLPACFCHTPDCSRYRCDTHLLTPTCVHECESLPQREHKVISRRNGSEPLSSDAVCEAVREFFTVLEEDKTRQQTCTNISIEISLVSTRINKM